MHGHGQHDNHRTVRLCCVGSAILAHCKRFSMAAAAVSRQGLPRLQTPDLVGRAILRP